MVNALREPGLCANTLVAPTDRRLVSVVERVLGGQRLDAADGRLLCETPDIHTVCGLADIVRRRMHGDIAYYNVNQHINYSNICALSCSFCAFHRKRGDDGAYESSVEQIREEAIRAEAAGATELHIVGGLHPWLPFDYYTSMLETIREATPELHIKAFTAVEIVHLQKISKRGKLKYEGTLAVLRDLRDAGLGSLPGGGAEVFDDRVHDEIFKGKIRADEWLDVHRAAHEIGLNTNTTMLYGHIDRPEERVEHLLILRRQQDETLANWAREQQIECKNGAVVLSGPDELYPKKRLPMTGDAGLSTGYFQTMIPLPFFPDKSALENLPGPSGLENLRTIALCRLMLDNMPHIKSFWIMQTLAMTQFMLQNGADDVDGTVVWYDITHLDNTSTHQETTVIDLKRAIREAGFDPVERDTLYRRVERDGASWRVVDDLASADQPA